MSRSKLYPRIRRLSGALTALALLAGAFSGFGPAVAALADTTLGTPTLVSLVPVLSSDATFALDASATASLAPTAALPATATVAPAVPKPAFKKKHHYHKKRRVRKKIRWKTAKVSWYGPGFYGHGMAGGGILTRTSLVVANRSLPFGTKILFRYKGRRVIAVVKDRGPFVRGRLFDLGPGTAKRLHFKGVGKVKYTILKYGKKKHRRHRRHHRRR